MIYHDFPIKNADFPARYVSLPEGHPPFFAEDHADDQGSHGLGVLGDARGTGCWTGDGWYIYILFIHISYVIYLINGGFNGKILTITNLYPLVI